MQADKTTILIVEDESLIRQALAQKLKNEGYQTLEAESGEEGLKKALETKPNLILLDIILPLMDGISVLDALRKDEWGKNAKVIILSNLSDETKASLAKDKGVSDYLIKTNWDINDVVKKIKQKLAA
ncbi:hypothetical protein A2382_02200 [Candidatus Woesebacteria bacterium RIFOXYB1_FULL_38_16]|uniref:Response regulatory domain-containing protein n=1 Tax=Candidatus Woesebacteria bacterium RIFOXYB1_FULL_38_16 TaxID=1802538 RepID=A0A1F8CV54_9BACT|nr:MAG: hypothetical protein A2191_04130 [Candidatus Woesebacteria bacterium RIFOXYA1_FULL_38_9]OGM79709.1 MAG: hypothetical protein A2382_02200 [Candidatus Woesebacteria bacterium RIFOXYB1_FULL_38_16]